MGCDIHSYIEYRRNPESGWYSFGAVEPDRNYTMFAILAGVRLRASFSLAAGTPKGVPEDLAYQARAAYYENVGDWHTPSWVTVEEL